MTLDLARSRVVLRGHFLKRLHREISESGKGLHSALVPDATRHPSTLKVVRAGSALVLHVRAQPSDSGWQYVDGFGGRFGSADDPKLAVSEIRGRFDSSQQ